MEVPPDGRHDRRHGRGRVGRRGRRHESRLDRVRLNAHIREQVDGGLPHARIDGGAFVDVVAVQSPRPPGRARPEDERAARGAVQRQIVRGGPGSRGVAVIEQILRDAECGRGQLDRTGRAKAVVTIFVPLVAEDVRGQGRGLPGSEVGDARIAPEAHLAVRRGNLDRVQSIGIDLENRAGQLVLRPTSVCGRAEPRIAPGSGPFRIRVDLGVRPGLLIGDECPIGRP